MQNREDYESLVQAIANGAIAMVGAGSSMGAGYPSWDGLLKFISGEILRTHPEAALRLASLRQSKDALVEAACCEELLGRDALLAMVAGIFAPAKARLSDFHRDLLRLPFTHYLTFNYDYVLEAAHLEVAGLEARHFDFQEEALLRQFLDNLTSRIADRNVVHVHGSVGKSSGIILTLDDYNRRYHRETLARHSLATIFTVCRCVFIGCGMNESDLEPLRFVAAVLGEGEPKHFALLEQPAAGEESALRERIERRYRIRPIFYPKSGNHEAIIPFMAQLRLDVERLRAVRSDGEEVARVAQTMAVAALQDVIKDSPIILAEAQRAVTGAIQNATGRSWSALASSQGQSAGSDVAGNERTPVDTEIDEIFRYVKRGEPHTAVELYERIEQREGNRLTPRLKYRVRANIGNAYYSMGEMDKAAEQYLQAAALRDTRDALAFRIMAYVLRREYPIAHGLARQLCEQEPSFGRAHWLLIASLPEGTSLEEAESLIPDALLNDAEVAGALGGLAFEQDLVEKAVEYGRRAVHGAPEWPYGLVNLSGALLKRERLRALPDVDRGLIPESRESMQEAESLLNEAIQLIPASDPAKLLPAAYLNRASARRLLGKTTEAGEDIRESHRRNPGEPEIAVVMAAMLDHEGHRDQAIALLESLPALASHQRASFLLAVLLRERGTDGDRKKAVAVLQPWMQRLPALSESDRSDVVGLLAMLFSDLAQPQDARNAVESVPQELLDSGCRETILARILFNAGDKEGARSALGLAITQLMDRGVWEYRREAAILAHSLGDYQLSLLLWRTIVTPKLFNSDTQRALVTARLAQDDGYILTLCRALRANGIVTRHVYESEADVLIRCHEHREAISLMQEWLTAHPDDKIMRLNLSSLAIERNFPELVETDAVKLPSVSELTAAEAGAVVYHVLRHGPDAMLAANYAYDLWRKFPDVQAAQHTLIRAVLDPSPGKPTFAPPERIDADSSVRYQEVASGRLLVAVIEPGLTPSVTRHEYAPDHGLAEAMLGKAVGETFSFQGHDYKIISIESKIVYRARECLEGFEEAFPNNPSIRRFTVSPNLGTIAEPKAALGEVYQYLEEEHERQTAVEGLYAQQGIPIASVAQLLGRSVLETMGYLAESRHLGVRCSPEGEPLWQQSAIIVREANCIVLDETAIASLFLLGVHARLRDLPFRCIVTEASLHQLRELRSKHDPGTERAGYLGFHDGRPVFRESSREQEALWAAQLDELIITIAHDCEVVGGSAVLDLPHDQRTALTRMLGAGAVHAIAIARQRKAPLWTDDLVVAVMAAQSWGVESVWTQSVLVSTARELGSTAVNEALGKAFSWGYVAPRLTADAAVYLFSEANWDGDREPAMRTIDFIAAVVPMNSQNCFLTSQLIAKIWFRCPKERQAAKLIEQLLERMPRALSGPVIARPVYRTPLNALPERSRRKWRRLSRFLRRWRCRRAKRKHRGR